MDAVLSLHELHEGVQLWSYMHMNRATTINRTQILQTHPSERERVDTCTHALCITFSFFYYIIVYIE